MDLRRAPAYLPPMTLDADLLIVGGGLSGPVMALSARAAGLSAIVIDALPDTMRDGQDFDGRSYALALASVRMLARLGVWPAVARVAQPILRITVSDGRAGEGAAPQRLTFDHAEIEEGPMGQMIEDRHLRRALSEALVAADIPRLSGSAVTAQETGAAFATATLAGGQYLRGRLIVGADGRQSGTARRAGIRRHGHGYGQTAVTCPVHHERPHQGTAHQFFMPAGPLAILPLPGNTSSIVWSETAARAQALMAMDDADFLTALRPAFGDFLGDIALAGPRHAYPLGLTLAERVAGPRLALVGDAAHGYHPIAGQGLNAGFRDIAALAHVLAEARGRGEDIGTSPVLSRYARWRRFDTATLAAATDGFNRLFSNDHPALRLARDLGLAAVNAAPPLRRAFLREAAGLTGDLPDLMRG